MEYLYDEMTSAERKELDHHLKDCAPCRDQSAQFQGTAQSLDQWRVHVPARHQFASSWAARWQPGLKWAAAAALLVTTAFATGRMSRPEIDLPALQAQISGPIEEKMHQEIQATASRALAAAHEKFQADLAAQIQVVADRALAEANATTKQHLEQLALTLTTLREEDKKTLTATLDAYEQQRLSDLRNMREDIERVALFSDESHRSAQRQFVQLASLQQADQN